MGRTHGKRKIDYECHGELDRLVVWEIASMQAARPSIKRAKTEMFKKSTEADHYHAKRIEAASYGDHDRVVAAVERSEQLIEEAVAFDERMAAKPRWIRGEDGIDACPALVAQGDDAPFLYRKKQVIKESAGGDPIRIVLSTDANEVIAGTGAALIAAVRLAQQFHPIEVWWQGAWLNEHRNVGLVFHIPLIQGDMDFTKLDYVIHDNTRDSFSWCIKNAKAMDLKCLSNDEVQADYSYLENTRAFVDHEGIKPTGPDIANAVCRWLGWDEKFWEEPCSPCQMTPHGKSPPPKIASKASSACGNGKLNG
jgi:hypothetical protein